VGEREELVHGTHRCRAFANRGRDAFGRAGTNVADREQPRVAGLEGQRLAV